MSDGDLAFLKGAITALPTPFRDGVLDLQAVDRLVQHQARQRTTAIVVGGATGEGWSLEVDEVGQRLQGGGGQGARLEPPAGLPEGGGGQLTLDLGGPEGGEEVDGGGAHGRRHPCPPGGGDKPGGGGGGG